MLEGEAGGGELRSSASRLCVRRPELLPGDVDWVARTRATIRAKAKEVMTPLSEILNMGFVASENNRCHCFAD